MNVLALIPARAGSKGIPGKNWKPLAGVSCVTRAIWAAQQAKCGQIVVSTDDCPDLPTTWDWLERPPELAQDDTPMLDVVKHALSEMPGPEDQIILLLQPTQPLRQPKHLAAAIELLHTSGADSVVSVVELPLTHAPEAVCVIGPSGTEAVWPREEGRLYPYAWSTWRAMPTTRQELTPVYIRDGTCYCFRRSTLTAYGTMYGQDCRPLVIPASETTPLDTPADWARAEELLRAR